MPIPRVLSRPAALAAALAVVAFAVWTPVLGNGFVWDDGPIIVENPDTRDLGSLPRVLLSPDQTPPYYRPLNRASYLLDHRLFGLDPRGFHAVSLALHVANVLLLFAIGRRLLGAEVPAALAALLFALHPVNAEAVSFVTARNNLFALLFSLAALLLFADAVRRRSTARAWASGGALLLGLLSKEQAAMTLPALLAWLWIVERQGPRAWPRAWRAAMPHALAAVVYLALRAVSLGPAAEAGAAAPGPLASRLGENVVTIPRLLGLVVFPRELTIFHRPGPGGLSTGVLVAAWIAIAAAVALLASRRTPGASFGLAWFALHLVPLAGVVAIPATTRVAERFLYLPLAGAALLAAGVAGRAVRRWPRARPAVVALSALLLVALAARSVERARDWKDDETLARSAVRTDPGSAEARFNLGVVLKDQGDLAGAREQWEAAARVDPRHARALTQLGTLSAVKGDLPGAERLLREALAAEPVPIAHLNLARILERTGRPEEALVHYRAFVRTATDLEASLVPAAEARIRLLAQ